MFAAHLVVFGTTHFAGIFSRTEPAKKLIADDLMAHFKMTRERADRLVNTNLRFTPVQVDVSLMPYGVVV